MNPAHVQLIIDNLDQLVSLSEYERLKEDLIKNGIITKVMMENIIARYGDETDQHRQLLIKMTHRGPRAFKILTTYLKIWPEAYKILNVGEPSENSNVLVTNTIMIDRERPTYEMNKRKRGLLVFINNINFDDNEKYPNRLGADIDTQHIKDLFGVYYHFEVDQFVKTNSTRNEYLNLLKNVKSCSLLKTIQCLVFIFSSHGSDMDEIAFTDGRSIKPEDIIKQFGNQACPELIGKPKIFIFPYCRGSKVDQGISETQLYVSSKEIEQSSSTQIDFKNITEVPDIREDMVVCFATLPGDVSSRESDSGTWYLNDLYQIFARHSHEHDLQKLLRKVACKTMQRNSTVNHNNKIIPIKQTPHTDYYNFSKMFYFNPGVHL